MTSPSTSSDRRLRTLYEKEWEWRVDQFADLTGLDILTGPDHVRFDRLPEVNGEAQQARQARWTEVMVSLRSIDKETLSAAERVNWDVYSAQIAALLEGQQYGEFEAPANSDTAFWSEVAAVGRRRFGRLEDYEHWIAQMHDIPRFFRDMTEMMRRGLRRGFTPPRDSMKGREHSIRAVIESQPEDTGFFRPFRAGKGVSSRRARQLFKRALKVITGHVQPSHAELLAFMQDEYLPQCRESLSAEALPNGKQYYRAKVRHCTTLDSSVEEIHEFGLAEVARLRRQMRQVLHEVRFGGSISDFLELLRKDPRFFAKSEDELMMRAAWIAKRFDGVASAYFGLLPRMRFAIVPVPDDIAPFYTSGRGAPGIYLLNTHRLGSRPLFNLPALTLHESAPGHAFQFSLALENSLLPAFRRHAYLPAYAEGWALYCERLGEEMGFYDTPYERFGMLGYQVWRAARLVVDTGLHAFGWNRARAVAYLAEQTSLSNHEISAEVDRYVSWPAQALSYYLGGDVIWKARAHAERTLGAAFDIRQFHDEILSLGSVPLSVVRTSIEAAVSRRASSARGADISKTPGKRRR